MCYRDLARKLLFEFSDQVGGGGDIYYIDSVFAPCSRLQFFLPPPCLSRLAGVFFAVVVRRGYDGGKEEKI